MTSGTWNQLWKSSSLSKSASHVGRGTGPAGKRPPGSVRPRAAARTRRSRRARGGGARGGGERGHRGRGEGVTGNGSPRVEREGTTNTARGGPGAQYTKVPLCTRKALSGPELTHPVLYLLRTKSCAGQARKQPAARSSAIKTIS